MSLNGFDGGRIMSPDGIDEKFMQIALAEAQQADSAVFPNPKVGCVIVKDGIELSRGFHEHSGGPHAEINALRNASEGVSGSKSGKEHGIDGDLSVGELPVNESIKSRNLHGNESWNGEFSYGDSVRGATMYVTLEPCNHHGKTPPCTDAIISAGISRVVIAMRDPNPKVNGSGVERLRKSGIEVVEGVLEDKAKYLNSVYITNVFERRAYVSMKIAHSMDGCVMDSDGNSKWITGESARKHGNGLRALSDAIIVGAGTIIADNPSLTLRVIDGATPIRVVIDPGLRTPPASNVYTDRAVKTLLIVNPQLADKSKQSDFLNEINRNLEEEKENVENGFVDIVEGVFNSKKLDISWLLKFLYEEYSRYHLLVEGGMATWNAFFESGFVGECFHYISPMYLGSKYKFYSGDAQVLENAMKLRNTSLTQIGDDVLLHGYLNYKL
jgi:diaminohydroxyphosphoribosylaminopyrimidine deaminase/5-amino-6-(5-phosphoribosylamino)uracil reductase